MSYRVWFKVAKALRAEWFNRDRGSNRYRTNQNDFHN